MKTQHDNPCHWDEIKGLVKKVNPDFYEFIDDDKYLRNESFQRLHYAFGRQVGDASHFYYPGGQQSKMMPFCMVLHNHFEMYVTYRNKQTPWKIYRPGQIFPYTKFVKNNALYEPSDILNMTAGVRSSFFLLNKFSDKKKHARLDKAFKLDSPPPKTFEDQFFIFKRICDAEPQPWSAQLLVFSESFEQRARQSPNFLNYLNTIANQDHIFKRNILLYDYILNSIFLNHSITNNSFVKEVIKYLIYIACGDQPAYLPSLNEANAPVAFLRSVYENVYQSETVPIMMVPHKLEPFSVNETVYYSLNKEDFIFKPKQISNVNKLTQEIKSAFEHLCQILSQTNIATNTLLHQCAGNIKLDVIHRWNSSLNVEQIKECHLLQSDKNIQQQIKQSRLEAFPTNSQFLSGCFSLSYLSYL